MRTQQNMIKGGTKNSTATLLSAVCLHYNPAVSHPPRTTHLFRHVIVDRSILKGQIELVVAQYFDLSGPALGDGWPAGVVRYLLGRGLVAIVQARAVRVHLQGGSECIVITVRPIVTTKSNAGVHSSYV
jgi:hypothetical protein